MESIWDFIKAMTLWNWLSLIAFIFLPLSVLNSFLSLKSRYLDWSATKNRKDFNQRLEELQNQLLRIAEYKTSLASLFIDVMHEVVNALLVFFFAFFLLLSGEIILAYRPMNERFVSVLSFFLAQMLLLYSMNTVSQVVRLIGYTRRPETLANKIIKLVARGKAKGLIPMDDQAIVDSVIQNNLFTESEKAKLSLTK